MLVFVNGCFDLLHLGHIKLLEFAYDYGNVFVGLNSDKSIKRIKGSGRPIFNQDYRKDMLLAIKYVYDVIIFDESTPQQLISMLNPNIIIIGHDHSIKDDCYKESVECGRKIIQAPKFDQHSTSKILKRIGNENSRSR
jgi:D-beta-D-heptose 7-phosphate kinase / D-beta-D-heptose 1-phosphate adenosyltransferase